MKSTRTTLAEKLGVSCHLSPLLRKVRAFADGEDCAVWLVEMAVRRGCAHYQDCFPRPVPFRPASIEQMSNEEIGVALCLAHLDYNPQHIRVAAELLSAAANDPFKIAHLAGQERCGPVVRYIAQCGAQAEPGNPFWQTLLAETRPAAPPRPGVLPHWTRFVSLSGLNRRLESSCQWLRPKAA